MRKPTRPIALLIGAAVIATALAAAAYLLLPSIISSRDQERPAALHPPATPLYAWTTLRPPGDQRNRALTLWDRLNASPQFRDLLQETELAFSRNNDGLDLREDVLAWAGPHFSIALVDPHPDNPRHALVVTSGVRDHDRAQSFLETRTRHHADRAGLTLTQDSYRGFTTWSAGPKGPNYALSDRLLVYAQDHDKPQGRH